MYWTCLYTIYNVFHKTCQTNFLYAYKEHNIYALHFCVLVHGLHYTRREVNKINKVNPTYLVKSSVFVGEGIKDAKEFGWNTEPETIKHDWNKMVEQVQNHIGSLNWGYRNGIINILDRTLAHLPPALSPNLCSLHHSLSIWIGRLRWYCMITGNVAHIANWQIENRIDKSFSTYKVMSGLV